MRQLMIICHLLVAACLLAACGSAAGAQPAQTPPSAPGGPAFEPGEVASQTLPAQAAAPGDATPGTKEEGAPQPPPATAGAQAPTSPAAPGEAPQPQAETDPERAVIVYRRSGGFAGRDDEWTVYADGRLAAKDGRQWQTSPEAVSALLVVIRKLGFFEVKAPPLEAAPCCDRFYYELTVIDGGQSNTAATYDGAASVPPGLQASLDAVIKFLEQAGAR